MSISGLMITLSDVEDLADRALGRLRVDRRYSVGRRDGLFVPVALEASTPAEAEDLVRELSDAPGITKVDVVYVDLDVPAGDADPLTEAAAI